MEESIQDILQRVVKALDDKRAEEITVLDMQGISILTDYNVIAHGNSDRQVKAIADGVLDEASKGKIEVKRVEGKNSSRWILIDLGLIVVHIFSEEERGFYNLEGLWTEANLVNVSPWLG